jgi:chaperonin cofactor prefoldin
MIGKIRKILGIDKLEQRIDTLENKIITTAESVNELRKGYEKLYQTIKRRKSIGKCITRIYN